MIKDEEHAQVLSELEALPTYNGWWFAYEYPGLFCYHHPDSSHSVFFTPDWSEDGEMPIEVQDNEGVCVDDAAISVPHAGRTGQKLFDLVKSTLDKHQPQSKEAS